MNKRGTGCSKQRSGSLHLTQKVDYGIMLLTSLANNEKEHRSIKKIAEEKNLSFSFLQKIAGLLQKHGIIKAERGKFGGYKLSKPPINLPLKEIIEALEGPIALVPCLKSIKTSWACSQNCEVRTSLQKLNDEIEACFSSKTLEYFIKNDN